MHWESQVFKARHVVVPKTRVSGFVGRCHGEMGVRQVEQGFSLFFAKFDDFSKYSSPKALWNFENIINHAKSFEKEWRKALGLKPIFSADSGHPICQQVIFTPIVASNYTFFGRKVLSMIVQLLPYSFIYIAMLWKNL